MPEAARIGDIINTGHECDDTAPIAEGSGSVFAEGIGLSYQGAAIVPHEWPSDGGCALHDAVINEGSSSVFVHGIPVARMSDSADLGAIIEGAASVFVGG